MHIQRFDSEPLVLSKNLMILRGRATSAHHVQYRNDEGTCVQRSIRCETGREAHPSCDRPNRCSGQDYIGRLMRQVRPAHVVSGNFSKPTLLSLVNSIGTEATPKSTWNQATSAVTKAWASSTRWAQKLRRSKSETT